MTAPSTWGLLEFVCCAAVFVAVPLWMLVS